METLLPTEFHVEQNLATALCVAQNQMGSAIEGGYNPHFKSSFATLTDLINASRPALTANGLAVTQYPESDGEHTYLITILLHSSGQQIRSRVKMVLDKPSDVQSFGKTMTYLKRYVYAAMVGITISESEDDDGNSNAGHSTAIAPQSDANKFDSYPVKVWHIKDLKKAFNDFENAAELEKDYLAHYGVKDLTGLKQFQQKEILAALKDQ